MVVRGGSWNNNAINVRTSNRNRNEPSNRNNNVGFRCANTLVRPVKMLQWLTATAASAGGDCPAGYPVLERRARSVPGCALVGQPNKPGACPFW
jgi:hypothetical protein